MADEKLCLKWNDFQNIVQTSLGEAGGEGGEVTKTFGVI